ncbi:uncharacterized protein LOC117227758 [Megalopta genalis]|uniref:uncharacterized protein LOC117227758 n=1 Tax=Megalopta genalis TaxID=115081 RepID=UPI003FD36264
MELIEEYQELIERDATEISWLFKFLPAFCYITSAVTGYICSILFYVKWHHAFDDNCPLWANSVLMIPMESDWNQIVDEDSMNLINTNWMDQIVIHYDYNYICKIYFITCFLSCIFGIIWSIMFLICGKGGYDVSSIYEVPWSIVFPATIFNMIFALITTYAVINLAEGYFIFSQSLKSVYTAISITNKIPKLISECEIIQKYLQHNIRDYDLCKLFSWLQVTSRRT